MTNKEKIEELHSFIDSIANKLGIIDYLVYQHSLDDIEEELEAFEELKRSHIEFVEEEDRCYFKLKNTKGKEKSFTSKTFADFWKEVFDNDC